MALITGVVNVDPAPSTDPPVELAYQFPVPSKTLALNCTVPGPHRLTLEDIGGEGIVFIIACTDERLLTHPLYASA